MPMPRPFAAFLVALATLAAVVAAAGWTPGAPASAQSTAASPTPPAYGAGIASVVYANAAPVPVAEPMLALARVVVAPGAPIAEHHHPGTQIGTVAAGALTYTVVTDRVELRRAGTPVDAAPEYIAAGETVLLRAGDTVIEPPTSWHHAVNAGDVPVEIWVATLFPAGAPRTEYHDPATPAATPAATPVS
jgi:quercetin dioxygenase-like cupin family protein